MSRSLDIAIVGLAGVYPAAPDADRFWQNICAGVDAITDADPEWVGPYFEAGTHADDRIYTTRGGFLRELAHVDPLEVGVMPSVAAGSDPDHLVALKVARAAMRDAGYADRKFDGSRAGVIVARGTYGNRGLASMLSRGFFMDQMMDVIRQLRPDFSEADIRELQTDLKKQLPPYGSDVVGVLTPNVIASLIANRLDLMGPAYIVDAACASSLIAIDAAVQELVHGRCDLMLAGGTQVQTPPQLFIQFCQINALSRDRLRPFQKGAEGTLLGEGCGMLVLKRLADAERDGDRVYAVIKGVGTASDGKAKGLLAPRLEGEILAMRRAYESSGIDPLTIDLVEAHGTGTTVGDATEIESLNAVFGGRGAGPHIAISAVKSMIGHCLPATGTASMIKTALALHHKVLPPTLCDEPDPSLNLERTPFYINNRTRPWIHGGATPRRAGVNAFGFGGINAHVILEEYAGPRRELVPAAQLQPPQATELVLLAAGNHAQLVSLVRAVLDHLRGPQPPSLAEIAQASARRSVGEHRLALVADDSADLTRKLEAALAKLTAPDCRPFRIRGGAAYGRGAAAGKLCLLFPGEGSQYPGMLSELCLHFPQVRDWFDFIEDNARARGSRSRSAILFPPPTGLNDEQRAALDGALYEMDIGAESVYAASLGLHALIQDIGLEADAMLGHSTGENTALTAGRVRRFNQREEVAEAVQAVNAFFRKLEAEGRIVHGTLLTVGGLTRDTRAQLMGQVRAAGSRMQLAMDNCPNQVVLFGPNELAAQWRERLAAEGAICQELPFGRAYHTPLFKPLADAFRDYFKTLEFGPGTVPLYSARHAGLFPDEPDAIRELAAQQWENPVRFTETVERLHADGFRIFLEVGPSANLTAFVSDTLRGKAEVLALSTNSRRKPDLSHLQQTLAQLFVAGVRFDAARLYAHRRIAGLDLLEQPRAAVKARPRLSLGMPSVRLPERWKQRVPAPSAPVPDATVPVPAPAADDPRQQALRAHFDLMQAFLSSQARVLEMAGLLPAGERPEVSLPHPEALRYPLLGPVQARSADRLVMTRRYDLETDLFLRDHCIGGTPSRLDASLRAIPVMPFAFSMEICAEAAACLLGRADRVVVALEQCRGSRWLSLDQGPLGLRIVAERLPSTVEGDRVQCRLFLAEGQGPSGVAVFEAQVLLAAQYPAPPAPIDWSSPDAAPAAFNADQQLYLRGMFHGPRLQGARQVLRQGAADLDMQLEVLPVHDYFAFTAEPRLQFDATLADVLGQTLYYWLQERRGGLTCCFPYQVARLSLYAPPAAAGTPVHCRTRLEEPAPERLSAQIDASTADGRLLMRAQGWDDRTFDMPERYHAFRLDPPERWLGEAWMEGLLPPGLFARRVAPFEHDLLDSGGGIWGRGLAHMVLSEAERRRYYALPASGGRRSEWLMGRIAAKEAVRDWVRYKHRMTLASADVEILADAYGRPQVRVAALGEGPLPAVSISHSQSWAAAVVAEPGLAVGLDYQRLDRIADAERLKAAFDPGERRFIDGASDPLGVVCALWCAREAAAKAAGLGLQGRPEAWRVIDARLDPRAVSFGSVRIRHEDRDYDVALQFEGRDALSALCLCAAGGVSAAMTS